MLQHLSQRLASRKDAINDLKAACVHFLQQCDHKLCLPCCNTDQSVKITKIKVFPIQLLLSILQILLMFSYQKLQNYVPIGISKNLMIIMSQFILTVQNMVFSLVLLLNSATTVMNFCLPKSLKFHLTLDAVHTRFEQNLQTKFQ